MTTQPPLLPLAAGTSTYRQAAGRERLVQDSLARVLKDPRMCGSDELLGAFLQPYARGKDPLAMARHLLEEFGFEELPEVDACRLEQVGLSTRAAIALKAAFHFAERLQHQRLRQREERPTINSPSDAAALVQYEMSNLEQEHLRTILLDSRNRVIDIVEIYKGSVNSSQVRVGEVFMPAIRRMAVAILVIHNHPSADPTPSPDDVAVTRAIVAAGKLLDIETLDHLVIGQGSWVSLKERGLGFG
jgi:DNA repair protein RadC